MLWLKRLKNPLKPAKAAASAHQPMPGEQAHLISLDSLQLGQCGLIQQLDLNNSDDKRLRTLGICPGRRVWLVRPGDPMVLKVMGTRIGLAAELAQCVTVDVCSTPCEEVQGSPPVELEQWEESGDTGDTGDTGGAWEAET